MTSRSIASRSRRIAVLAGAVAALLAGSAEAAAKKKIVVLPFDGPKGEDAQAGVMAVIKRKHTVLPADDFGASKGSTDDLMSKAARKVGADGVVAGIVRKRGPKWELVITVRDGGTGSHLETVTIPLSKGPAMDDEATSRLGPTLMPSLLRAKAGAPISGEAEETAAAGGSEGGDTEATAEKKEEEDEESDEGGAPSGALPLRLLEVTAGLTFVGRSFAYDNQELQAYGAWPTPGFLIGVESYPLHGMAGPLSAIGVGASFAIEPFNKARLGGQTAALAVTQRRWAADVRYAIEVDDTTRIIPHAGVGNHTFAIAGKTVVPPSECPKGSTDICLADVKVTYLSIGADVKFALNSQMTLLGSASFLPGLMVATTEGQIASDSGSQDMALGFGIGAGLAYKVTDSMAARAGLNFTRFSHALTLPSDFMGNAYAKASDSYIGGDIAAQYAF